MTTNIRELNDELEEAQEAWQEALNTLRIATENDPMINEVFNKFLAAAITYEKVKEEVMKIAFSNPPETAH